MSSAISHSACVSRCRSAFAYQLSEHFDIGARVRLTTLVLGGILPFAGELTSPQLAALRLNLGARL